MEQVPKETLLFDIMVILHDIALGMSVKVSGL